MKSKKIIALLFLQFVAVYAIAQQLAIGNLTVNYKTNPIGIDTKDLRFSWKIQSPLRNLLQRNFELKVATSEDDLIKDRNLIWNTGKIVSEQSVHVAYKGAVLQSKKRYYW